MLPTFTLTAPKESARKGHMSDKQSVKTWGINMRYSVTGGNMPRKSKKLSLDDVDPYQSDRCRPSGRRFPQKL
jgi:hypothetical protein